MNRSPRRTRQSRTRGPARFPGRRRLGVLLLCALLGLGACGQLRPRPAVFAPKTYTPIDYQDLISPRQAGLYAGKKIRVKAYFWQYLDYDPAMVRNYLTLLRYPVSWYKLRWFATYDTDEMTGYYDLAAISPELAKQYHLRRLDKVLLYGELSRLGPGLFFQIFSIEKIPDDQP